MSLGPARRLPRVVLATALLLATSGCIIGELRQTRRFDALRTRYGTVSGTVDGGVRGGGWMTVFVATAPCDDDWRALVAAQRETLASGGRPSSAQQAAIARVKDEVAIAAHFVLQGPGEWEFRLAPGCYGIGAYQDVNRNGRYDDDEPAANVMAAPGRLFELRPGETKPPLALTIAPDERLAAGAGALLARPLRALETRTPGEQLLVSVDALMVAGAIANLRDPRFGAESGRLGYFDVYRFVLTIHPGIYFLEPYDPEKIPVLFVHGATGHPSEFATLAAGIDRTRFQPWFFYYPSGARLEAVSTRASQLLARLQERFGFERLAVVAHSMGGLVARALVFEHHERMRRDPIRLFVSISTPWGGMPSAAKGVERSPIVVPSWKDVATGSRFLNGLFFTDPALTMRRRLPAGLPYYLVFGVDDTTIPLPSGIRWEALRDAKERWPLPYDHTAILRSPELVELLNEILARELG